MSKKGSVAEPEEDNSKKARELSLRDLIGVGYDEFWNTKCRYVVCRGSRNSKKSYTTAFWIIINMMDRQYSQANTLVVRKVGETLRDSCYALLEKVIHMLGVSKYWKCKTSPLEMTYMPTGQKIIFRGLDDPYKLSSITVTHGVLCWGWLEEAYQVNKEEDFDRVDESLRGIMPDGLWIRWMITFNPWNKTHWLRTKFFEEEDGTPLYDPDIYAFRTNYLINEWCSDADIRFFERMKQLNPKQYEVSGLGNWGTPEGMIYDNWEELDFDYNKVAKMEGVQHICGLDFGFSADPTALVALIVDNANYTIWVYDEIYEKGLTSKERAKRIKAKGYAKSEIVYDSANPLDAQELLEEGIQNLIPANKTATTILNGINRIRDYKIYIHPRCVNFLTEIQNYAWFVDKDGVTQPKPAPASMDHLMDACMRRGTLIKTINGDIPIENIKVGDYVLTHYGYQKVKWAGKTGYKRICKVRLSDGTVVEGTVDHPFITEKGLLRMDSIRYSKVIKWNRSSMMESHGCSIKKAIISDAGICCSIGMFGKNIKDLFQKVCKSIISINARPITTSAISNCAQSRSMSQNIPGRKSVNNVRRNTLQDNKTNAVNGTNQKKVVNGIRRIMSKRCTYKENSFVSNADYYSSHKIMDKIDSVLINANPLTEEEWESITREEFVRYAEKNSSQTNIPNQGPVLVDVQDCYVSDEYDDVYNLEVENAHTFFANGILVHNCRYAMMGVAVTGRGGFIGDIEEDWKEQYKYDIPTDEDRKGIKEMVLLTPKPPDDDDDDDDDELEYGIVYST